MKTGGQTKCNANTWKQKEFLLDASGQSSIVNLVGFKKVSQMFYDITCVYEFGSKREFLF